MVRRHPGHRYALLFDEPTAAGGPYPPPPGVDVVAVGVAQAPSDAAATGASRTARDMLRMALAARRLRCDVFFFPASYSYFPVVGPPLVVVVHDAIAERFPALTLPSLGDRARWRIKQEGALRQARAIVTVSQASRRAILETFRLRPDRLHVIREAPAAIFRPHRTDGDADALMRYGLVATTPYFLYVGGISPHKNLLVLVEAFNKVATSNPAAHLVLVGAINDDPFFSAAEKVQTAVARSPASARIILPGFVPDEDLAALYRHAVASVQPSLAEGYGLTAAESAACGTPVVASRDPALIELLGSVGLYADAQSPAEFAEHLATLGSQPTYRAERAAAVLAKAAHWSWSAAADTTVGLLVEAAHRG